MKRLVVSVVGVVAMLAVLAFCSVSHAATIGNAADVTLTGGVKYNVSDGSQWWVTYTGIDLTNLVANPTKKALNLVTGDNSSGSGWENFPIQIHKDLNGAGGHLLQAYDMWWIGGPKSSHGFNVGDVTGAFDIRFGLKQNLNDTWVVTPQYCVPIGSGPIGDGSWHTFYDGAFTSASAFDLTVLQAWARVDPASAGTAEISGATVIPEPATMGLLALGGVGMLLRRRRTARE